MRVKRRTRELIEIMFTFLLIIMLTGAICYAAGFMFGRAYESRNINKFIEHYHENDDEITTLN